MFLTDVVIPSLKEEISRLQHEALDALKHDDKEACQKALRAQSKAIEALTEAIYKNQSQQR